MTKTELAEALARAFGFDEAEVQHVAERIVIFTSRLQLRNLSINMLNVAVPVPRLERNANFGNA